MAAHRFQLRAHFDYAGENTAIENLGADIRTETGWQALEPELGTPGFLLFVYSLLACQHTYFHANCVESGLRLDRAALELLLVAGDDWKIESVVVRVEAGLRGGEASADKLAYIESRMRQCPVSINLVEPANYRIELNFG